MSKPLVPKWGLQASVLPPHCLNYQPFCIGPPANTACTVPTPSGSHDHQIRPAGSLSPVGPYPDPLIHLPSSPLVAQIPRSKEYPGCPNPSLTAILLWSPAPQESFERQREPFGLYSPPPHFFSFFLFFFLLLKSGGGKKKTEGGRNLKAKITAGESKGSALTVDKHKHPK